MIVLTGVKSESDQNYTLQRYNEFREPAPLVALRNALVRRIWTVCGSLSLIRYVKTAERRLTNVAQGLAFYFFSKTLFDYMNRSAPQKNYEV